MRYPKWFARWRLQLWDDRLKARQSDYNTVLSNMHLCGLESSDPGREAAVTEALRNRTKWRKRAGVRKLSAAPDRPES